MQRAEGLARIAFRQRDGATRLERMFQEGCAKVRLPRQLPGMRAEAILINTAGGLTGGDRLSTDVELGASTSATLTTQACERIYRSTGAEAVVSSSLRVGKGAKLAWLPQETILFDGGRLARRLEVDLADDAELVAVEAVLFGRTARGEQVRRGALHDRWRIRRDGKLIFADDLRFAGDIAGSLAKPAAMDGRIALATVLFCGREPERFLEPARVALGADGGISAWGGKLVARLAAVNGLTLRRRLESILSILLEGRDLPKVWQT